ncbi:hypothetical protein ACSBR1_025859 [Camellia fascicularis]
MIFFKFCKSQIVVLFSMKKLSRKRSRIEDVRDQILRKRRAGKLPSDTTSVLKNWWQQHAKWPYPTVVPKPYTFMPFGSGVHDCPRNELANLEICILILHSLAIFERFC